MDVEVNSREWALIIWVAVGLASALTQSGIRPAVLGVARSLFIVPIIVATALMAAWIVGVIWSASQLGAWDDGLVVEVVIWFASGAFVLFLNSNEVTRDGAFVRRAITQAVGITVLIDGVVNLYVFSLPVELVLLPVLAFLTALLAVSELKEEWVPAASLVRTVLALFGVGLVLFVAIRLVSGWGDLDPVHLVRALALPVWLTLGVLPYIYALGLYGAYDKLFRRLNSLGASRRAKAALLMSAGIRARCVGAFGGPWPARLARAKSFGSARSVMKTFLTAERQERAALQASH